MKQAMGEAGHYGEKESLSRRFAGPREWQRPGSVTKPVTARVHQVRFFLGPERWCFQLIG